MPIKLWMDARLGGEPQLPVPLAEIKNMRTELSSYVASGKMPEDFMASSQQSTLVGQGSRLVWVELGDMARQSLKGMLGTLAPLTQGDERRLLPIDVRTSLLALKDLLNTPGNPSLVIVQCNRDDELRSVASQIVTSVFDERRRVGRIAPSLLFIFDEADEFIPSEAEKRGATYVESRDAVTTLARRGRKFGLGVAIATQRVAYLDTSIMAQLHTYLISKLTREYDRKAIATAYGISEDLLQKTLKFMKGQWLLVSFDATGLENVPIPVQFPNANDRILQHLKKGHPAKS